MSEIVITGPVIAFFNGERIGEVLSFRVLKKRRRTNRLHRRPAKWWRHPKAWTTIRGKHWGKSLRSYFMAVAKDHRQNERRWKNATN